MVGHRLQKRIGRVVGSRKPKGRSERPTDRLTAMLRGVAKKSEKLRDPALEAKGPRRTYFEGRLSSIHSIAEKGDLLGKKASLGTESNFKHTACVGPSTFGLGSEEASSIS